MATTDTPLSVVATFAGWILSLLKSEAAP